jgi:hypothetical protein
MYMYLINVSNFLHFVPYIETSIIGSRGRRGCDRMIVGFTTTYAISAYPH